ncbi:hypothetical protein GCM10009798_33300 [Nocardioides panacihumi]|uniref:DivIVA domain-containing protein n=1 Tax=Nocardioides panacihumi TaxID=400774 RepID=A0ABN2RJE3_9ACTN
MNESLATEVEHARFTPTRFREGYDMAEVDRFLDDLCVRLRAGESVARYIAEARFTPVRLREGYDMGDVDSLLGHVASTADAAPAGDTSPVGEDPSPADSDWRNPISEVRSPLARLFRRREER